LVKATHLDSLVPMASAGTPADRDEQHREGAPRSRSENGDVVPSSSGYGPRGEPGDAADVHGIPAAEFTPRVAAAIADIMTELDRCRADLSLAREREDHLRDLADGHPYLPLLGRRALLRDLRKVLERAAAAATSNAFIWISLLNGEDIRRIHGHAAARAAMLKVAETLAGGLRASDLLGSLGAYDFGIVLTLAESGAAEEKAARLVSSMEAEPLAWQGVGIALDLAFGLYVPRQGEDPAAVADAADVDLRHRIASAGHGATLS